MPIYPNLEKKLVLAAHELSFSNVIQLLKSSAEFNDISTGKIGYNPVTHSFYCLPPRFPVIDGFVVVGTVC